MLLMHTESGAEHRAETDPSRIILKPSLGKNPNQKPNRITRFGLGLVGIDSVFGILVVVLVFWPDSTQT